MASRGYKTRVPATLNPAGMDMEDWRGQGIPEEWAVKQMDIVNAFEKIGVSRTLSCIPYSLGELPPPGASLAFAESSAVSFVNSFLGGNYRTNRENSVKSIIAALTGFTTRSGLHLDENRAPELEVLVECDLKSRADYGALGYFTGLNCKDTNSIPMYRNIAPDPHDVKTLAAAGTSTGSIGLFYVEGLTAPKKERIKKTVKFDEAAKQKVYNTLNTGEKPDLMVFGCPHFDLWEIEQLVQKLPGSVSVPFWIYTARLFIEAAEDDGHKEVIEKAGGRLTADSCMVVSPLADHGVKTIATDSAKAAKYLNSAPPFGGYDVVFRPMDELLNL